MEQLQIDQMLEGKGYIEETISPSLKLVDEINRLKGEHGDLPPREDTPRSDEEQPSDEDKSDKSDEEAKDKPKRKNKNNKKGAKKKKFIDEREAISNKWAEEQVNLF